MGAARLTLPSCALTWARSAVLTNSACRSWVNGSSPVVRCWPGGSSTPTSSPGGVAIADARLPRDSLTRRLAHEPLGWRPTTLLITIRRYRCTACGHVWRQDTSRAAEPRAKLSRRALRLALEGILR